MTISRATLYVGGAALLAAWLASAASMSVPPGAPPAPRQAADPGTSMQDVAADVQAQAHRLRERRATAPTPQRPARNPFEFRRPDPQPIARGRITASALPAGIDPGTAPGEPPLALVGIAADGPPGALVRTAMLTTTGVELLMVRVGDRVLDRYTVGAIGAQSVELTDTRTGRGRRLVFE